MEKDSVPFEKYTEERPWGKFEQYSKNLPSTVKVMTVNPGEALSLQTHSKRAEFWRVISGEGELTIGDKKILAHKSDEFFVAVGVAHRMSCPAAAAGPLEVLELSFGDFDETDIVRLEDNYKRD